MTKTFFKALRSAATKVIRFKRARRHLKFTWCDTLELTRVNWLLTLNFTWCNRYVVNRNVHLLNRCNKGRLSLWILWCDLSTAFSSRPRLVPKAPRKRTTALAVLQKLCKSPAQGDVHSATTCTQTPTHTDTKKSSMSGRHTCKNIGMHPYLTARTHTNTHTLTFKNPFLNPFTIWEQYSYGAIDLGSMVL